MGNLSVDGRIILKSILKKYDVRLRTGSVFGPVTGSCESDNGSSDSTEPAHRLQFFREELTLLHVVMLATP